MHWNEESQGGQTAAARGTKETAWWSVWGDYHTIFETIIKNNQISGISQLFVSDSFNWPHGQSQKIMAFQSGCTGSLLEGKRRPSIPLNQFLWKDSCYKNYSLVYLNYIDVRDKIRDVKMILRVFSNLSNSKILWICINGPAGQYCSTIRSTTLLGLTVSVIWMGLHMVKDNELNHIPLMQVFL